ncbi:cell division protein FtsK/SpoIIIE [Sulfobacillus acidophilus TPY]|nr:cell division protein FtsK/SpoIIIE [Sulfobacillus acidophilus TPY]
MWVAWALAALVVGILLQHTTGIFGRGGQILSGGTFWQALRQGPPVSSSHPPVSAPPGMPHPSVSVFHSGEAASPRLFPSWEIMGEWGLGLGLLIWGLWGTLLWAYNTSPAHRTWSRWGDWMLWRWPIVTAGLLFRRPDWVTEAWRRHRALQDDRGPTLAPTIPPTWMRAAQALDQGFAQSLPDVAWMTTEDGQRTRRMHIVATPSGIGPQWPHGFHAPTMEHWREWAAQWGPTVLVHAGVGDAWQLDAWGFFHPLPTSGESVQPIPGPISTTGNLPPSPPSASAVPLSPATQWGRHSLKWGDLMALAPESAPPLAEPLEPARIEDVISVLNRLGLPGAKPIGGFRGLTVDIIEIRPEPAWANRLLTPTMAMTLAGQLGHGDVPLNIHYVRGKPGVVAIERPRPDRRFVDLMTVLAQTPTDTRRQLQGMAIPICLGVTPDGQVVWSDMTTWPHCLIGGTTNSGKTTVISSLLTSLTITMPPSDLRITIVDPKHGSQFPWVHHMPHIDAVLLEPDDVVALVAQWADEQEERYKQFAELGVPDLITARQRGMVSLPYRLLVIDEYKDLKDRLDKDAIKEFERNIGRLGQKARGAGFYLWIATQHPLANIISSPLKSKSPYSYRLADIIGLGFSSDFRSIRSGNLIREGRCVISSGECQ